MNFDGLIPVILCDQIDETLAFYQRAFRYIIIKQTITDDGLQWAHIKSDNTYLMLQKNASEKSAGQLTGNIMLHYYTSDITAQHRFMAANGIYVGEIEITPYYMSQFYVEDPEGNVITIGQDISAEKR